MQLATSTISLIQKFKRHKGIKALRLALNALQIKTQIIIDFINNKIGSSMYTLNFQSIRAHATDLIDTVGKKVSNVLLSETLIDNRDKYDITYFNCIAHSKRDTERPDGVVI